MTGVRQESHLYTRLEEATQAVHTLYRSLPGWFNIRTELLRQKKVRQDPVLDIEIASTEQGLAEVLGILRHTQPIELIADSLKAIGVITSRGDVLRIAALHYDEEDMEDKEEAGEFPLVCIVGNMASGKGTVGELLGEQFGFQNFPVSERLREIAAQTHMPPYPREQLRKIDAELRDRFGEEVCMRWTLDAVDRMYLYYHSIGSHTLPGAAIDGIRSLEAAKYFRARSNTALIAVTADPDIRYQRLVERARPGDDSSRETFDKTDQIEGARIRPIIQMADITLVNEGTRQVLAQQVTDFMSDRFGLSPRS